VGTTRKFSIGPFPPSLSSVSFIFSEHTASFNKLGVSAGTNHGNNMLSVGNGSIYGSISSSGAACIDCLNKLDPCYGSIDSGGAG
jgi:hypothetical protein